MDDTMDVEVNAINATDCAHILGKEGEYSLKPGSSNMLEFQGRTLPCEGNDHENSHGLFSGLLDAENIDRIGASKHACTSPRCMDDAGIMVEELKLKNLDSGNLAFVTASDNREQFQTRQNQWQQLCQETRGIGNRNFSGSMPNVWEDFESTFLPSSLGSTQQDDNAMIDHSPSNENKLVPSNKLFSPGGFRTKIMTKSGFSQYFVKNTLGGKGVICRGPTPDRSRVDNNSKIYPKYSGVVVVDSETSSHSRVNIDALPSQGIAKSRPSPSYCDGVNLRVWLKTGQNRANKVRSLYIFRQILVLVDLSHSQGVALQGLRPSYFKLLPSNEVMYLGSPKIIRSVGDPDMCPSDYVHDEKRPIELDVFCGSKQYSKKGKFGDSKNSFMRWPRFPVRSSNQDGTSSEANFSLGSDQNSEYEFSEDDSPIRRHMIQSKSSIFHLLNAPQMLSTSDSDSIEETWYTCPEKLIERRCTLSSNIYSLGILLFELLSSFDNVRAHAAAMSDMHHRILPPSFLSENPKEGGFCLWLLHPEPSSRPTIREILHNKLISGVQELLRDELSSSINQEDAESELLLHFLVSLKEQKQKDAAKLMGNIKFLESDISEVEGRGTKGSTLQLLQEKTVNAVVNKPFSEINFLLSPAPSPSESRLIRNISQLESVYFSMRSEVEGSNYGMDAPSPKEGLRIRENHDLAQVSDEEQKHSDRLGVFFKGLCKYARYSKFEVRGILRNGDFNSSANVICSLSFDRDEDYFAAAGISKKIKIYEFHALLNNTVDIHYPAIEMPNKSRLSCICWNSYIRNYLASTDYDGVVKLWDAGIGQAVSNYSEHGKRAWSVDFSPMDPMKLASGSDDFYVKLWSINEKSSLSTIRNIANVCCVQFSPFSPHLLSFGSADFKTYCYDLRKISNPLCILAGHDKAISFVKFLDSHTLVSASTDNTLKLWDLNKASCVLTNACILTFRGHTNEKNFVGLSVADGYIACGSETNEVFSYYRSLPMPITSHKFGSIDPISGKETENDNNQFVSSVCWRQKSDMVVAANSSGSIKLLQLV